MSLCTFKYHTEERVLSSLSLVNISEEKKKVSKKETHCEGIKAKISIIFENIVQHKNGDDQVNAILAFMSCEEIVTSKNSRGEKSLMKATQLDTDLFLMALFTWKKAKELGEETQFATT